MSILEELARNDRNWTTDEFGCAVQYGDLLDDIVNTVQADYGLFSADEIGEVLDEVLTNSDGENRKTVKVDAVRAAFDHAGIVGF